MPTHSQRLLFSLIATTALRAGCVKFDVKPEHVVAETVEASKEAFSAINRKRTGEELRTFTHQLPIGTNPSAAATTEAANTCLKHLKQLAEEASERTAKINKEATEIIIINDSQWLKCSLEATI